MTRKIVLLSFIAVWSFSAFATDYYVDSEHGDDGCSGTSPQQAWKTLERINAEEFKPGDRILFKAGTKYRGQLKPQGSGRLIHGLSYPIVIDMYGEGGKPCIEAEGKHSAALYLFNVEYWEVNNLKVTNNGSERKPRRYGVYIHIRDFGTAHHIQLKNLEIHDINGSLVKREGGGGAISYRNEGKQVKSRFDGLLIENCHILRCERNAITGSGYWKRNEWFPNLNVVIRGNLIEQVPGDGIVPSACDGALVEYNIMRDFPRLLPEGEAAAGIWPWSSDHTVIQYNEVSDHRAPWDGQGFDADWNCNGTLIQYNYSHNNEGGFLLICNDGNAKMPENAGNKGTVVRYNLSVNDGIRQSPTHIGIFSPTFHISGPCENTSIYHNTIYIPSKPVSSVDRTFLKMGNWGGSWPVATVFSNNIIYVEGETSYDSGEAINTVFDRNLYYGKHLNAPEDTTAINSDPLFTAPERSSSRDEAIEGFRLRKGSACIGAARPVAGNGNQDFTGAKLPLGGNLTNGAFEYNSRSESSQEKPMGPWHEAKFGLFLHWGPYSIYGGSYKGKELWSAEWIQENARIPWEEYSKTAASWNPSGFDAREWVGYAKAAGMRYLVVTSRHHDGFAMYPSKASSYNLMEWTKYQGPDPLAELKKACRQEGLLFGIYYSPLEFRGSPNGFDKDDEEAVKNGFDYRTLGPKPHATDAEIADLAKKQIRELILNYEPDILWFDGCWNKMGVWTREDAREVTDMIQTLAPNIIINDRVGAEHPDFTTFEGLSKLPKARVNEDWEFCWNIGCFWGYNPRQYDMPAVLKTPEHYVELLAEITSKGGNYLLNVGPDPDGRFHPVAVKYLQAIGEWVRPNGECIYGASPSPFPEKPAWGYVTSKPGRLYLIVRDWPGSGEQLSIPALKNDFQKAYLLQDPGKTMEVSTSPDQWTITVQRAAQQSPFTVIVLKVAGVPEVL